jgi:hypothetical protein
MKTIWDFAKEIGWIAAVGILFLLAGLAFGLGLAPGDLIDMKAATWTADKKIAVALSVIGLFIVIVALAIAQQKASAASATAGQAAASGKTTLDMRMKAYGDAERTLKLHKALSYRDDPKFVSRVVGSAKEFEGQMRELWMRPDIDESSKDFLSTAGQLAKEFYMSTEEIEYRRGLNMEHDIREDDLSRDERERFISKREEWVKRTQALFSGAATMLGVQPPRR